MVTAVISLGGITLHQGKQQGGHGHVVDADVGREGVDVLLPGDMEVALHQKFKHGHHHDAEQEQQAEFPAVLTREHGQAVMVHVIAQQDVAIVVGKGAEHVLAVMGRLDEDAVLIGDE